ncbi:MAG: AmmeMemoRadiSam system radical SAM enzyme [Prosthecochloris sp.]|nr:AmmeMemoRadiSam system radical SAM enzyme [Prosthecochloris sp.]
MKENGRQEPARGAFWHALDDQTVQCDLCHRFCRIREGQPGFCRTRVNRMGSLFSLNYAHPASIALDPVEKKPLYHFMPGSMTFSLGTFGCNFRCGNCQNWQISQDDGRRHHPAERSPQSIVREAIDLGAPSVSFTYNEPTVCAEYALDCMRIARRAGLKTIWVTNGYMSDNLLEKLLPLLDAVNVDLKSVDDAFYRRVCQARVAPVLRTIERLAGEGVHLELTTLLIPGFSDGDDMLKRAAEFIVTKVGAKTPWHLSAFVPAISWRMQNITETPDERLEQAYSIAQQAGMTWTYSGVHHQNTFCPSCGSLLIERDRFALHRHDREGHCPHCGTDTAIKDK